MPIWPCAFSTWPLERVWSWAVASPWAEMAGAHHTGEGQWPNNIALWATGGPMFALTPLACIFLGGCNTQGGLFEHLHAAGG